MAGWVLTKGLVNLRTQINDWAPTRDHTSDGTIGDAAHQAETSGHNPDDTPGSRAEWNSDPDSTPEVRAFDCDTDFRNGVTAQVVVDHIKALPGISSVIRYIIYNRKIYKAANGWKAETYTGPSAHTEHIHFTGAYTQAADNNDSYNYRLGDIPVALTEADKTWISQQIATITATDKPQADGTPTSKIGRLALSQGIPDGTLDGAPRGQAWEVIQNLGELLADVADKVDTLAANQGHAS